MSSQKKRLIVGERAPFQSVYRHLLSIALSLVFLGQVIANDDDRVYANLYGFEPFPTTGSDLEMLTGLRDILRRSDGFANAAQPDVTPHPSAKYDFIVVGAGSAGSIVASRLSEVADATVLLIEAGDEEGYYMDIPISPIDQQTNQSLNWEYKTEPSDKYCRGMENHQCIWPRGKVMGGSSVLNFMLATRGFKKDFDNWANVTGDPDWSYDSVLKYFKKMENMLIPELAADTKYHATGGPMSLSYAPFKTPLLDPFMQGAHEKGYRTIDYNAHETIGVARVQTTTLEGSRMSSNRAYLHSNIRKNLHVTKNSLAIRVLISRARRAYGVEYVKNNVTYRILANKEIILTSGVIGSAQLLMLSGVGPAEDLRNLGIKVKKNAPVGENLQDHIGYLGLSFTIDQPVSLLGTELTRRGTPYIKDFLANQKGPLSIISGVEGIIFTDVYDSSRTKVVPNVEIIFLSTSVGANPTFMKVLGFNSKIKKSFEPLQKIHSWSLLPFIMNPKSRGWMKLRSANINDKPIIVPNYFDHPDDLNTLLAAINESIALSQTKPMQRFNTKLFDVEIEECTQFKGNFNKYYECASRSLTVNIYHQCGTCKMGSANDRTAVVDPQLLVIGVEGLRVADASIFPKIPSLHINLPVYMVAEKVSEMIKKTWKYL